MKKLIIVLLILAIPVSVWALGILGGGLHAVTITNNSVDWNDDWVSWPGGPEFQIGFRSDGVLMWRDSKNPELDITGNSEVSYSDLIKALRLADKHLTSMAKERWVLLEMLEIFLPNTVEKYKKETNATGQKDKDIDFIRSVLKKMECEK